MRHLVVLAVLAVSLPAQARSKADAQIGEIVKAVSPKNIEASVRKLVSFHTRHTLSDTESETRGVGAAWRWIQAELQRISRENGDRLKVELDEGTVGPGNRIPRPTRLVNVVATLPGAQPESKDRLYVVSGHYDSRASDVMDATSAAPGANDDASGVAAVIELARVMSRHQFDATLVFMAVAGEEQGLYGAAQWARAAAERKANVAGMITNDIIGNTRGDDGRVRRGEVRLFAEGVPPTREPSADLLTLLRTGGENDTPPRQLARAIKALGERHVRGMKVTMIYRRDRYLRGGDHGPFLERGYPAVRLTEPVESYRHQHQNVRTENGVQYGDLPELVDYGYVAQVTRVNAAALAGLALAPAAPAGVEIDTSRLENDTTLRWRPGAEPDLAGYRIVWRDTTAPLWQQQRDVGNVTQFTVPGISKDNVIFGVQALDRDGNTSPATYPRPTPPPASRPAPAAK